MYSFDEVKFILTIIICEIINLNLKAKKLNNIYDLYDISKKIYVPFEILDILIDVNNRVINKNKESNNLLQSIDQNYENVIKDTHLELTDNILTLENANKRIKNSIVKLCILNNVVYVQHNLISNEIIQPIIAIPSAPMLDATNKNLEKSDVSLEENNITEFPDVPQNDINIIHEIPHAVAI